MSSLHVVLSLLLCGAAFTVATFPLNPQSIDPQYRQITVEWGNITNFNTTDNAKQLIYQIEYFLPNRPSYLTPRSTNILFTSIPMVVIENLYVDSTVSFRIGMKPVKKEPLQLSNYVNFTTKSISDVGDVAELPDKVTNIAVSNYNDISRTVDEIYWNAPANIIASNNEKVKSIEYLIELCHYNPLLMKKSKCETVAKVVGVSGAQQNSRQGSSLLRHKFMNMKHTRDVAIVITPIALNQTKGASEMASIRMDSSSIPAAPTNLRNITFYANQITIRWSAVDNGDMSYLIQYNIKGSPTKMSKTSNFAQAQLSNLQNNTVYEIRVAISDSNNGTSPYSSDFSALTSENLAPTTTTTTTKAPKSSSSYLFSSYFMIIFTIAAAALFV